MFTDEALKRFKNPKNAGELRGYNGKGESGDPGCSDVVQLFIRFHADRVIDGKFKVFGCPGAISTTDAFIDIIRGKMISEALKITDEEVAEVLGGLPITHMHCSNLPIEAFRKAWEDYKEGDKNV